jgi:hypothetical protein
MKADMLLLATQLQESEERNNFYSSTNNKTTQPQPSGIDSDSEDEKEDANKPMSDKRLAALKAQLTSKDKKLAALKQVCV